jgi:hypothetical protein
MNNGTNRLTTAASISRWTIEHEAPRVVVRSDTNAALTQDVVLIPGRLTSMHGTNEVVISVEPSAVDRKLAIRDLNGRLQGRTAKSNTSSSGT